jgi:hypothetical protein
MAGIQTSLASLTINGAEENPGAAVGADVAATVQSIVLRAQEAVQLCNLAIAKIGNNADALSVALTNCVTNYLT